MVVTDLFPILLLRTKKLPGEQYKSVQTTGVQFGAQTPAIPEK